MPSFGDVLLSRSLTSAQMKLSIRVKRLRCACQCSIGTGTGWNGSRYCPDWDGNETNLYCVPKKPDHQTHGGDFVESYPIFKMLSLLDSVINLQQK